MESQSLTSAKPLMTRDELIEPMQQSVRSGIKNGILTRVTSLSKGAQLKLKILFSLILFASLFVFGKVDLTKTIEVAFQANLWFLSAAILVFVGSTILNAYRWKLLAAVLGFNRPVLQLLQYCFVGLFFNLFLPSTVGGDVSRCYYLSKGTGRYKQAFYSVLADRAVGIAVLFMFATLGILFGPGASGLPGAMKLPIFAGTFGVFCVVPLMPLLSRKLLGQEHWLTQKFNNSSATIFWTNKKLIVMALLQSVLLQAIIVGCHILIGWSLGLWSVPLWYYFIFYPAVAVLGFITPSFNGIGVREGAYTYFLMLPVAGVDKSHAFTFAVIWLGLNTFISLVGGLVYLAGHFHFSQEEAEKLQHEAID
jgi:uncharacterized membrane protein YbhN (UPF0104 family)